MTETDHDWLTRLVELERERVLAVPPARAATPEPRTIHYSELPEDTTGSESAVAWNLYRREAGRLLAEGHEGRWVLLVGTEIVGIWETEAEADDVRQAQFSGRNVLLKQIRTREPLLRTPTFLIRCRL